MSFGQRQIFHAGKILNTPEKPKLQRKPMKSIATRPDPELLAIEKTLIKGDLAGLNEQQRLTYVKNLCRAIGVSIMFQPFDYLQYNGKTILYAKRSCAEQLRSKHKISLTITSRERIDGLYCVTARGEVMAGKWKGRVDEALGAVNIKGLGGKELANALMTAESKAKRRLTLSICGLSMIDEIEAMEMVEQEARAATGAAIETSQAKIAETTARPEFEEPAPPSIEEQASEPAHPVYTLKAGKIKGKRLDQVPYKKLTDWMKWYVGQVEKGKPLHADIQDDAFHIQAYIDDIEGIKKQTSMLLETPNV